MISYRSLHLLPSISFWVKFLWWQLSSLQAYYRGRPVQEPSPLLFRFFARDIFVNFWKFLCYQVSLWLFPCSHYLSIPQLDHLVPSYSSSLSPSLLCHPSCPPAPLILIFSGDLVFFSFPVGSMNSRQKRKESNISLWEVKGTGCCSLFPYQNFWKKLFFS